VLGESAGNYYQGSGYALIVEYVGILDRIQIKNTGSLRLSWENWAGTSALFLDFPRINILAMDKSLTEPELKPYNTNGLMDTKS
jgi:hypothetical protein